MRISEVLMDGEDDTVAKERRRDKSASFLCFSPRLLLFRWLSKGKRSSELRSKPQGRESRSRKLDGGDQTSSLGVELTGERRRLADVSGRHLKEDQVNLAVGFGLFYLIAASKNELSKMIELRREMEVLVHSARNEFETQTREILYESSESHNNRACSTIDVYESLCSDGRFSFHNLSYENPTETLTSYSCDQSLMINTIGNGKCVEGIDQLEAELEYELERLQVRMDTTDYPRNQRLKVPLDDSSLEGSWSASLVEVVDIQEVDNREQIGVCAHELERRLHELLQSRQQHKIEELEADLQLANQKLLEREKEVSWWKDTARIFSHHVATASRLSRLGQAS